MLDFPNQEETRDHLYTTFEPHFSFASKLYQFWMFRPKTRCVEQSHVPWRAKHLAMLLSVQACRQFRTAVTLCEEGESLNAAIVAGSLFETLLATAFVSRDKVRIAVVPVEDDGGNPVPGKFRAVVSKRAGPAVSLSRDLRAVLYLANSAIVDEKFAKRHATTKGLRRIADFVANRVDPSFITQFDKAIGPEWSYVLRHRPHSYSGLSVAELSRALGTPMFRWYNTIYGYQSRIAHGTEAIRCIKENEQTGDLEPACYGMDNEVLGTLQCATAVFLGCLSVINRAIDFGWTTRTVLKALHTEFLEVFSKP